MEREEGLRARPGGGPPRRTCSSAVQSRPPRRGAAPVGHPARSRPGHGARPRPIELVLFPPPIELVLAPPLLHAGARARPGSSRSAPAQLVAGGGGEAAPLDPLGLRSSICAGAHGGARYAAPQASSAPRASSPTGAAPAPPASAGRDGRSCRRRPRGGMASCAPDPRPLSALGADHGPLLRRAECSRWAWGPELHGGVGARLELYLPCSPPSPWTAEQKRRRWERQGRGRRESAAAPAPPRLTSPDPRRSPEMEADRPRRARRPATPRPRSPSRLPRCRPELLAFLARA
ncbi:unnamed protein product [Urochloa humidicola]